MGKQGFIKVILIIITGVIVLIFLKADLRGFLNKPIIHDSLSFFFRAIKFAWEQYILRIIKLF